MTYKYRPVRFYATVFALTWVFWIAAAIVGRTTENNSVSLGLMLLGLFVPSAIALYTVLSSGDDALKKDLRLKFTGLFRVKPLVVVAAIITFGIIIATAILLSTLFGQSLDQFALVDDFSFAGGGIVAF